MYQRGVWKFFLRPLRALHDDAGAGPTFIAERASGAAVHVNSPKISSPGLVNNHEIERAPASHVSRRRQTFRSSLYREPAGETNISGLDNYEPLIPPKSAQIWLDRGDALGRTLAKFLLRGMVSAPD